MTGVSTPDREAPLWVRAFAAGVPYLPVGRYWMVHHLRRVAVRPFMMRLPERLGGFLYECDQRDSVSREVCYTGWYEPQETQLASRLLRPDDVFVDVGANWGYFSLAAAHWVGPGGRVIAFEPEPRLYRMLSSNIAANGLTSVAAHRVAIAAGPGRLSFVAFRADEGNWGRSHAAVDGASSDFECATVGLDDALDAAGVGAVQLVKVDVEGGEGRVLAGMRAGLARGRYRYVLLECHPAQLAERGESEQQCVDALLSAGYRAWTISHSPDAHRRAARVRVSAAELLRPYLTEAVSDAWPHIVAAAPGAPDPA
jgi:FkbM family methyltransferase